MNKNFIFTLIVTGILTFLDQYFVVTGLNTWMSGTAIFLLSYPWKISKHVYSLFGGYSETNIYSLVGIFQKAGNDAIQVFGFSLFQKAGNDAIQRFGFRFYVQGNLVSKTFLCIHVYNTNKKVAKETIATT